MLTPGYQPGSCNVFPYLLRVGKLVLAMGVMIILSLFFFGTNEAIRTRLMGHRRDFINKF